MARATTDTPADRVAYLGPEGTFCEQALAQVPEVAGWKRLPAESPPAALELLRAGQAGAALVPIESTTEGSVLPTMDDLLAGTPLHVVREVVLPVRFAALVRPGTTYAQVRRVGGHPHARPQCRRWLAARLPDAAWTPVSSNGEAAKLTAEGELDLALAGAFAAARYGLHVLDEPVNDTAVAQTRFVLVRPPGRMPRPTGTDKTSLVAFERDDHPGALLEILTEFAVRGVNLTRLESRPTGAGLGRYCFWLDCQGHIADARVGEALSALRRICADVLFLGSYPSASDPLPPSRAGTGDDDFDDAARWLEGLRAGGPGWVARQ